MPARSAIPTFEELLQFAMSSEDVQFQTLTQGKSFHVFVKAGELYFRPGGQIERRSQTTRVNELLMKLQTTDSWKPGDYAGDTFNASYLLALVQAWRSGESGTRSPVPARVTTQILTEDQKEALRLRTFVRWLQQFEPDTEVPDDTVFGRMPERKAPHIYSEQEVIDLLASARRLGPASSLRGVIFETLFGLIASTGLRISEALSLKNADVDLKTGMLSIRLTKFGKSRQVPVHPSTLEALRQYRLRRDLAGESYNDDTAFFVGSRGQLHGLPLGDRQVHRFFGELRRQLGWPNRGSHHAARIHDLRHNSEAGIIPSAASAVFYK